MKLNVVGVVVTAAFVWGILVMFVTGTVNLISGNYGLTLLKLMASLYPGYEATPSLSQVIIGTCYGILDGAFVGLVFVWIYNRFAARTG